MATINTGPAAVNTGATTTTLGPLDRAPAPVSSAVDPQVPPPTPVFNRPVDRAPDPVAPGPGLGISTTASSSVPSIPVTELPVDTANQTSSDGGTQTGTPIYIKVLSDGTVVTSPTTVLNFLGTGVSVTANGTQANITITGSDYSNSNVISLLGAFGSNPISTTGNITGGNMLANGSMSITGNLTVNGNATLSGNILGDRVQNGTTSFDIQTQNGNANITVAGTSNVVVFATTGVLVTGLITASGNITGGNVLTGGAVSATGNVAGNYFIGNGSQLTGITASANTGNLDIVGTTISIADGASETYINLSASAEGWAYVQVPTDATANVYNTRIHNDAGNIEFGTGDYSTGSTNYTWTLDNTGNLTIPGAIISASSIDIDNRASGNTADIRLYSADDILLQARDRSEGSFTEGGDINIYAGDSATDSDATGGDVQIYAGNGGASNVDFGGQGGTVRIQSGDGGAAGNILAGGDVAQDGGAITLQAGSAGDNAGNIDLGAQGGDVFIYSGYSTGNTDSGGNIVLTTGTGGQNGASGNVQINIPGYGLTTGGTWTFDATGNLNLPTNGDLNFSAGGIKQALNEDLYIRGSDNEEDGWAIFNVIDDGAGNQLTKTQLQYNRFSVYTDVSGNNYSFDFRDTGELDVPKSIRGPVGGNLVISIGDQFGSTTFIDLQTRSYVGDALISNIRIGDPNVTISTAAGAQNWVFDSTGNLILPADGNINAGTANTTVALNAYSPAGNIVSVQAQGNTSSAVISIFSNAGPVTSNWTFTTAPLDPSESFLYIPNGGAISTPDAPGGEGGKNIFIQAGASDPVTWNSNPGGELMLKGGYGSFGDGGGGAGGDVNIEGGASSDSHAGNVNISSGLNTWTFDYTGNLSLPPSSNIVGVTANNSGYLNWFGNSSGDGAGYTTLRLVPDDTREGNDQYLIIDPTAPGHIHIRAGGTQDNSGADLFLGGENSYFKIAAGSNSQATISSNSNAWVFNTDGNLQVPGNINGDNSAPLFIDGASSGEGFIRLPSASFGGEQVAIVNQFSLGNGIALTTNGGTWHFGNTGELTAPGPMSLAVYANTTVRDSSITSPTPGMMIYVTGTGMQVRGATSWNTVAGTGT